MCEPLKNCLENLMILVEGWIEDYASPATVYVVAEDYAIRHEHPNKALAQSIVMNTYTRKKIRS